jgi:hypothetical protein
VNDGQGASTQATQQLNVSALGQGTVASDSFTRTLASGWGSADIGGAYSAAQGTTTGSTSTSNGTGAITLTTPSTGRGFYLPGVSQLDTDSLVDIGTSVAPAGGAQAGYITARRISSSTEYRARLRFMVGGAIKLAFVKTVGSTTEVAIGSEITLSDVPHALRRVGHEPHHAAGTRLAGRYDGAVDVGADRHRFRSDPPSGREPRHARAARFRHDESADLLVRQLRGHEPRRDQPTADRGVQQQLRHAVVQLRRHRVVGP